MHAASDASYVATPVLQSMTEWVIPRLTVYVAAALIGVAAFSVAAMLYAVLVPADTVTEQTRAAPAVESATGVVSVE